MSVPKFEYEHVFDSRSYLTFPRAPSKSMEDILDQFKALNTLKTYKNHRPFESFKEVEKDINREHMVEFKTKLNELKRKLEEGKINPDEFKLEITSFEELKMSNELCKLIKEKIESLQPSEAEVYREAEEILRNSRIAYGKKELEEKLRDFFSKYEILTTIVKRRSEYS